jgi:hypothetical protein
MTIPAPVAFNQWIEEIRPQLVPPVGEHRLCTKALSLLQFKDAGNKLLYGDHIKIMVVGGPNTRADYHIEKGEVSSYCFKGA